MVTIKNPKELRIIREGGKKLHWVTHTVVKSVEEGISTLDLDRLAEKLIAQTGGEPSFKGFQGYPSATCISVNEELVHSIPRASRIIRSGDIISIDIGLKYKGLFTDMSITVPVGQISKEAEDLINATKRSLDLGINQVKPGNKLGDIGQAIQAYAESRGYSVVRALVGHGVGYEVHEDPPVPNFGRAGQGLKLKPGMVLALEPMLNVGGPEVETLDDGWTVRTVDGLLCAHFEHTVAVTERGVEILTAR